MATFIVSSVPALLNNEDAASPETSTYRSATAETAAALSEASIRKIEFRPKLGDARCPVVG